MHHRCILNNMHLQLIPVCMQKNLKFWLEWIYDWKLAKFHHNLLLKQQHYDFWDRADGIQGNFMDSKDQQHFWCQMNQDLTKFCHFHDLIMWYAVSRGKVIDGRPLNGFLRNFMNRQAWPLYLYVTINRNDWQVV